MRLGPGEILVTAATRGVPTIDRTTSVPHFDLPAPILAPVLSGDLVRLGVAIESNGLFYVAKDDVYIGTVRVGLVDDSRPSETRELDSKVRVLLASTAEVSPDTLVLDHTNLPFKPVVVRARTVQTDSVTVRIRPAFEPDGYAFRVAVWRPKITIGVSPARIDGFGLQRALVSVSLPNGAGSARSVIVSGMRNAPIDSMLVLNGGETKFTRIASRGIGVDTIQVSSAQLMGALVELRYVFPYGFIVALVIGAVIGMTIRAVQRGGRTSRKFSAGDVVGGLALGALVAVAYSIGVNLIGIPLPAFGGEAVTLVGAALGALLGESAVKRIEELRTPAAAA